MDCSGCKAKEESKKSCQFSNKDCPCKNCLLKSICMIGITEVEKKCPVFDIFYKRINNE
jgi:hypothetical protein